jgi:hypothetical protein
VTQQPGGSGPDLIGEFQRWLIRSSARGVGRQVTGQLRTAFGRNQPTGDVWETATADPAPDEAPECAWCPLCRAARVIRESKSGRDTRVTAVSDALGTVVQDAFNVLEAALAATGRAAAGADARRGGSAGAAGARSGTAKPGSGGKSRRPPGSGSGAAAQPPGEGTGTGHAHAETPGTAGQESRDAPGSQPPEGSLREPDDRG